MDFIFLIQNILCLFNFCIEKKFNFLCKYFSTHKKCLYIFILQIEISNL